MDPIWLLVAFAAGVVSGGLGMGWLIMRGYDAAGR
jgi:hypothetical protein